MSRILITAEFFGELGKEALDLIESAGFRCEIRTEIESRLGGSEEALSPIVEDMEGLIVGGKSRVTKRVIDRAPRLRVISKRGVGVDNIDVAYAKEKGIVVAYTPHVVHKTVADHAMALLLGLAKNLLQHDRNVRQGKWVRDIWSAEVSGKTLGIIGLGHIGRSLAGRGLGFEMTVLAYDPMADERFIREHGIIRTGLEDLLKQADFVSIHVPLTPSTRGLIGEKELSRMKPTSYLINTSRGETVDETALIDALRNRRIGGAALDVFENEPLPGESPLRNLDNVLLTPHAASSTRECFAAMERAAAEQAILVLQGKHPEYVV